jgi:hypothetical protein
MTVNQMNRPLFANYQNAETICMSYDILRQNAKTVLAVLAFWHFGITAFLVVCQNLVSAVSEVSASNLTNTY